MTTCAQGGTSKMLFEPYADPVTWDDSSLRLDFNYSTLRKIGRIVGGRGITGTRSNYTNRTAYGASMITGRIAMDACAGDLDFFLPYILGGSEVADEFDVASSLPAMNVMIDKVGGVFEYINCKVSRAIFRAQGTPADSEPEVIEMILELMGVNESTSQSWPDPEPSLSTDENRRPYIHGTSVLTLVGASREMRDFVLLIDNHLQPRWVNSLTPTIICPRDRTVMLRTTNPFTTAQYAALYGLDDISGDEGATLQWVAGNVSTTWTFGTLQWADESPKIPGKTEIPYVLDMIAKATDSQSEVVVTNDSVAAS
jgi:hypothetical protein